MIEEERILEETLVNLKHVAGRKIHHESIDVL